jgi:opacity protein-like surface antigen
MKNALFVAAAMAVCAVTASAATPVEDADGNGAYSMAEIAAAYPGVTEEAFTEMDTDQSGEISEDELAAAIDAGTLAE